MHRSNTRSRNIAIALSYSVENDLAPITSAIGERLLATDMKRIAHRFGIPVFIDDRLARELAQGEEESYIAPKLYVEVAKVLHRLTKG